MSSGTRYQTLIASLWAGDVEAAIATLTARLTTLGPADPADPGDGVTHPRTVVADAIRFLTNQAERMRYAADRRAGLPITTSHIESTIKLMNRRVKGTEMFWSKTAPKRSSNSGPTTSPTPTPSPTSSPAAPPAKPANGPIDWPHKNKTSRAYMVWV